MKYSTVDVMGYGVFDGESSFFTKSLQGTINTINPNAFYEAGKNLLFREALSQSDILIPDGIGISIAAWVLHGRRIRKIAGYDLHQAIIGSLQEQGGSCFYLGSEWTTLDRIKEKLGRDYPSVRTGFYSPPFKKEFSEADTTLMTDKVNSFKPDVLFVGMTAPKQEKWVYANRQSMSVPLVCSIGAVFDFYAGTRARPGKLWIKLGLEWFIRLISEPRRLWKRTFVSAPYFAGHLLAEKARLIFSGPRIYRHGH